MTIEASATESGIGEEMVWNVERSGNRLALTSNPQPQRRDPSTKIVVTWLVWERVE